MRVLQHFPSCAFISTGDSIKLSARVMNIDYRRKEVTLSVEMRSGFKHLIATFRDLDVEEREA